MDLSDLGRNPISEQEPAGKDARFEPDMEVISAEIEKLSSPTASGGIDWRKIADLSARILAERSKDLLVAAYLCMALLQIEQLKGFARGVRIIRDLVENFWETMYPVKKRMRGRKNAVEWWLEKTTAFLEASKPVPLPQEEMEALQADIGAIEEFLARNMEDAPALGRLQGLLPAIEALPEGGGEGPPPEKPQDVQPLPQPQVATAKTGPAGAEPSTPVQGDSDAERALKEGLGKLAGVASFYMAKDIYHPMAYSLTRMAAWTSVAEAPPSTDGRTRIPAPPQTLKSSLDALYRAGEWEGLLKTAEARIGEFLFWLDLNRYVAESLEHLGHQEIGDMISQETALYVRRLKGVESLFFSDGTPFADQETREWLGRITSPPRSGAAPAIVRSPEAAGELESKIAEECAKARSMVKEKKLGEAVALLHSGLRDGRSGRERMLWRLALCDLLASAGRENTAFPHLQEVLIEVDEYRLEVWDPEFALQALRGAYSVWRAQKGEPARTRAAEILDRIARLDPAVAVEMGG
ncbi:MAG: type VI secretion system protein TssA [Deltaproteobacteria bacterium]|nr:type VI secretion system protein TssA [Deltaproteobacteria bacterium]